VVAKSSRSQIGREIPLSQITDIQLFETFFQSMGVQYTRGIYFEAGQEALTVGLGLSGAFSFIFLDGRFEGTHDIRQGARIQSALPRDDTLTLVLQQIYNDPFAVPQVPAPLPGYRTLDLEEET
jgi:hypothetical protein